MDLTPCPTGAPVAGAFLRDAAYVTAGPWLVALWHTPETGQHAATVVSATGRGRASLTSAPVTPALSRDGVPGRIGAQPVTLLGGRRPLRAVRRVTVHGDQLDWQMTIAPSDSRIVDLQTGQTLWYRNDEGLCTATGTLTGDQVAALVLFDHLGVSRPRMARDRVRV
jgi:hypothetical protein